MRAIGRCITKLTGKRRIKPPMRWHINEAKGIALNKNRQQRIMRIDTDRARCKRGRNRAHRINVRSSAQPRGEKEIISVIVDQLHGVELQQAGRYSREYQVQVDGRRAARYAAYFEKSITIGVAKWVQKLPRLG